VVVIGDEAVAAKFRQAAARVKATQKYMLWDAGQVLQESIMANIMKQGLFKEGRLVGSGRTFGLSSKAINVGFAAGTWLKRPTAVGRRRVFESIDQSAQDLTVAAGRDSTEDREHIPPKAAIAQNCTLVPQCR